MKKDDLIARHAVTVDLQKEQDLFATKNKLTVGRRAKATEEEPKSCWRLPLN